MRRTAGASNLANPNRPRTRTAQRKLNIRRGRSNHLGNVPPCNQHRPNHPNKCTPRPYKLLCGCNRRDNALHYNLAKHQTPCRSGKCRSSHRKSHGQSNHQGTNETHTYAHAHPQRKYTRPADTNHGRYIHSSTLAVCRTQRLSIPLCNCTCHGHCRTSRFRCMPGDTPQSSNQPPRTLDDKHTFPRCRSPGPSNWTGEHSFEARTQNQSSSEHNGNASPRTHPDRCIRAGSSCERSPCPRIPHSRRTSRGGNGHAQSMVSLVQLGTRSQLHKRTPESLSGTRKCRECKCHGWSNRKRRLADCIGFRSTH